MKRIVEDTNENVLENLLGETVTFFSLNYIYTGKLTGVNSMYVVLEDPKIVYETGSFDTKDWINAQALPNEICIMLGCVEAFGIVK